MYPRLDLDLSADDLAAALEPPGADPRGAVESAWRGPRAALACLSVRSAFDLWLRALALPAGSEVLMSAVTVRDMPEIVRRHGLVPVPVDVDLDTLAPAPGAVERARTPRSKVLVVAHLYGALADLAPYRGLGLLVAEDCAQAYAGDFYRGDPEADLSLFSFGPIKTRTALGGATALVKDPTAAARMRGLEAAFPPYGELRFVRRVLKAAALKGLSRPGVYGAALAAIARSGRDPDAVIGASLRGFGSGDLLREIRRRPADRCLSLLARRLSQGGVPARIARAERFLARLDPGVARPGRAARRHAHWLVPVLSGAPDGLCAALRAEGFDATRGTTSMRVVEGGETPNARRLIAEAVYLPLSGLVPDLDLARLAELVRA